MHPNKSWAHREGIHQAGLVLHADNSGPMLLVFSVTLFEKNPLNKVLFDTKHIREDDMISNQLNLFDI